MVNLKQPTETRAELDASTLSSPNNFLRWLEDNNYHHMIESILLSMDISRQRTNILLEYREFLQNSLYNYKNAVSFLEKVGATLKERDVVDN